MPHGKNAKKFGGLPARLKRAAHDPSRRYPILRSLREGNDRISDPRTSAPNENSNAYPYRPGAYVSSRNIASVHPCFAL
jgi:hypothetical protein